MESTPYVRSFRTVSCYLMTTDWIVGIGFIVCEISRYSINPIHQSIAIRSAFIKVTILHIFALLSRTFNSLDSRICAVARGISTFLTLFYIRDFPISSHYILNVLCRGRFSTTTMEPENLPKETLDSNTSREPLRPL